MPLNHRATICASIPSDAQGNGHALKLRATICASIPSDAQGNGHALNHRVTTGASIPSDAHGNGHALKLLERERKRDRSRVGEGHFEGQRRRKCVPVFVERMASMGELRTAVSIHTSLRFGRSLPSDLDDRWWQLPRSPADKTNCFTRITTSIIEGAIQRNISFVKYQ